MTSKRSAARASKILPLLSFALASAVSIGGLCSETPLPHRLTVADAISTTRLLVDEVGGEGPIAVSPDGRRYVIGLIRGDIARNSLELTIAEGYLTSLPDASHVHVVIKLYTTGLASPDDPAGAWTLTLLNPLRWLPDGKHISFFWTDEKGVRQAVAVDVDTGRMGYLTRHATNLYAFDVAADGTLIYSAAVAPNAAHSSQLRSRGFAITDSTDMDALDLMRNHAGGAGFVSQAWLAEFFVVTPENQVPRKVTVAGGQRGSTTSSGSVLMLSHNGHQAIIGSTPAAFPSAWNLYTGSFFKGQLADARQNRMAIVTGQVLQLFLVDLDRATAQALWTPPIPDSFVHVAWAPGGESILVGPTFLPIGQADSDGLAGNAVAEVNLSGRFKQIPLPRGFGRMASLRWLHGDEIEVSGQQQSLRFVKHNGFWVPATSVDHTRERQPMPAVRVDVRQDLNTPPALYAVDPYTGHSRLILDLNPGLLHQFTLGKVEQVRWNASDGRTWSGLLYYPVHRVAGRRYPLVIQTHGYAPASTFSLYGYKAGGLGPGAAPFAAQPLANRDIAVLQIEDQFDGIISTPQEGDVYMRAYEAAAKQLADNGLIDERKVGLSGWSRTGFHVEYAITHSTFPYAAALVADNFDAGYQQAAILGWPNYFTTTNGAAPFGDGLRTWLRHTPAFNAEHVRTPLQIQVYKDPAFILWSGWEMFSRLRALKKPVEIYVVPEGEHAGHELQNPRQCLASQGRAVDWFDFWLNGNEDSTPDKAEQYRTWRHLKELAQVDARKDTDRR